MWQKPLAPVRGTSPHRCTPVVLSPECPAGSHCWSNPEEKPAQKNTRRGRQGHSSRQPPRPDAAKRAENRSYLFVLQCVRVTLGYKRKYVFVLVPRKRHSSSGGLDESGPIGLDIEVLALRWWNCFEKIRRCSLVRESVPPTGNVQIYEPMLAILIHSNCCTWGGFGNCWWSSTLTYWDMFT